MVAYSNGYIPSNLLVTFNVGWSPGEGEWKHQLSAATYAKHLALVALARKNTGRTLTLSNGWSGYRPYSAQVYARQRYGNGAAWPGTSSHGGFWEGQQTLAIDYGNWSYVYNGSRDAFYRDCRAVGFEPGLISPQRGYPDEPWHVVDKTPWAAVASSGSSTQEDDMTVEDIHIDFGKKGGQPVKAGEVVNLHINDAKDVSVARGAAKHVSGNLVVQVRGGEPYKGAVQVTPVVRTVESGKPAVIASLRAREVIFTGGDTFGEVAVNCALTANQRLSFRIGGSSHDFTVVSATFRGMKVT